MKVFFFKSVLSLFMLLCVLGAMFTMFEVFGRSEKRFNIESLKKIHRTNGIIYLLFFIFIAYFCLVFIVKTKAEPSPRAALHGVFALTVIVLLILKISFVRVYRQFYGKVQTIGFLIAVLSLCMIGTSAGYFFLVAGLGDNKAIEMVVRQKEEARQTPLQPGVKTDPESIARGRELYESKCNFCHDPYSSNQGVGPGHKGILKNPLLPVSKKPATHENAANQLKTPFKDMPSFSYLSEGQIEDIIAFLNTL